jgi:hypothetical protein
MELGATSRSSSPNVFESFLESGSPLGHELLVLGNLSLFEGNSLLFFSFVSCSKSGLLGEECSLLGFY